MTHLILTDNRTDVNDQIGISKIFNRQLNEKFFIKISEDSVKTVIQKYKSQHLSSLIKKDKNKKNDKSCFTFTNFKKKINRVHE